MKKKQLKTDFGSNSVSAAASSDIEIINDENEAPSSIFGFAQRPKRKTIDPTPEETEDNPYFLAAADRIQTSDHTLSQLEHFRPTELIPTLRTLSVKHEEEIQRLIDMHSQHFCQLKFELEQGFNLVFFGYGSKLELLDRFMETLTETPILVVKGFYPNITIKHVLSPLLEHLSEGTNGNPMDQLVTIQQKLLENPTPLTLVIPSMDGFGLRSEQSQHILSQLAAIPCIRLIATIEHINAPLLWDHVKLANFNFVWHDWTTFKHYDCEISFENSLIFGQFANKEKLDVQGAVYVLQSLPLNTKKIFELLAEHQLSSMKKGAQVTRRGTRKSRRLSKEVIESDQEETDTSKPTIGIAYRDLLRMCQEQFLASSEAMFRTQLVEFRDHHLLVSTNSSRGEEILQIPLDQSSLEQLVELLDS